MAIDKERFKKWLFVFDIFYESTVIPIRVMFPNLRPHLFAPLILHGLGYLFGQPLQCENATLNGSHPSVALVLVELDIMKLYPDCVWICSEKFGYIQKGHFRKECSSLHPCLAMELINSLKHVSIVVWKLLLPLWLLTIPWGKI
ncbi:hypothetical protein IEQ34_019596 [Dendrobium chrysotoxum]|uniref:Uncharacterized protein n=1 Tax=Dendrobium chrysotoxum TaxID=161865 RepID=A0AAV7G9U9_DENCH|nr:hypothetical protein IEQ34_019596 [Dendrobium chrysotoxum]